MASTIKIEGFDMSWSSSGEILSASGWSKQFWLAADLADLDIKLSGGFGILAQKGWPKLEIQIIAIIRRIVVNMLSRISTTNGWYSILITNAKCIRQTSATFWYRNANVCRRLV